MYVLQITHVILQLSSSFLCAFSNGSVIVMISLAVFLPTGILQPREPCWVRIAEVRSWMSS